MTFKKLSQITPSAAAFTPGDYLVGVQAIGGPTDVLFNSPQTFGLVPLQVPTTFYVRTQPTTVTVSIGSGATVSWISHGLAVGDPVIFSSPLDRGECTITIASPAVVTKTAHGYVANDPISFNTSGALPTGITSGTTYFVIAAGLTANDFRFSTTSGGAAVNTSGTQSGHHYVQRVNTLATGITDGAIYYVIAAGFGANTFQFSTTAGGSAVTTSGTPAGRMVAQTGNNSNTGLAQTRSGAFLSLWGAMTAVFNTYNLNNNAVTFQIADGTYLGDNQGLKVYVADDSDAPYPYAVRMPVGTGNIVIRGNNTTPDSVNYVSADGNGMQFQGLRTGYNRIEGMRITSVTDSIVVVNWHFTIRNLHFGGGSNWLVASGSLGFISTYNGSAVYQILASPSFGGLMVVNHGGEMQLEYSDTIRAIGAITVNPLIWLQDDQEGIPSNFSNQGITFEGTWSGTLYTAYHRAEIINLPFTGGGEMPAGLTPGSVSPFGRYYQKMDNTTESAKYGADGAPEDNCHTFLSPSSSPFSTTLGDYDGNLVLDPTGTIAVSTITMPPNPGNGHMVKVWTSQTLTALTISPNSGQSIKGNPSTLAAGGAFSAIYHLSNTTWYCGK